MSHYETALICRNGHVITEGLEHSQNVAAPFCKHCGAATISACPACGALIRGHYYMPAAAFGISRYSPPSYCHQCGVAYPWTQDALDAWREIAREVEGLSDEERGKLAASIDDLVSDGPRTQLAVQRLKTLVPKMATGAWNAMREMLVSVATDAVKKSLGLG